VYIYTGDIKEMANLPNNKSLRPRSSREKPTYHEGRKVRIPLLMISRSRESTPIGATKNNWNRNFSKAMITIITTMIMIM
jgi:hypothetical protein